MKSLAVMPLCCVALPMVTVALPESPKLAINPLAIVPGGRKIVISVPLMVAAEFTRIFLFVDRRKEKLVMLAGPAGFVPDLEQDIRKKAKADPMIRLM